VWTIQARAVIALKGVAGKGLTYERPDERPQAKAAGRKRRSRWRTKGQGQHIVGFSLKLNPLEFSSMAVVEGE
jgi:hypothetical protein